jgi:hypothetical protein
MTVELLIEYSQAAFTKKLCWSRPNLAANALARNSPDPDERRRDRELRAGQIGSGG